MRALGVPAAGILGGIVGYAALHDALPGDDRGFSDARGLIYGGLVGFGVGAIAISAVDAIFLARETTKAVAPAQTAAPKPTLQVLPSIDAVRRSACLGVIGTF